MKVHFAGNEEKYFHTALKCADVHYSLYSVYKSIVTKNPDDDFTLPRDHKFIVQDNEMEHVIQDSGLFTLMFGAGKGEKQTIESLTDWQDKLIAFVTQNKLGVTCVEIDCQKVLGVEEAWFFRERMKKKLPNRQINVFHFEDGKKGLDRMIEFSDYIAVSVPELRIVKGKTYREDTRRLTWYIKNRKPSIDIHLLGCTQYNMLEENSYCTSCDSTSWLQGVKYGWINDGNEKKHIKVFRREIFEERRERVKAKLDELNVKLAPKTLDYTTNASICATICKQRYEKALGKQEGAL